MGAAAMSRTRGTAMAVAVVSTLALTACSGNGTDERSADATGTPASSPTASAPSVPPSATVAATTDTVTPTATATPTATPAPTAASAPRAVSLLHDGAPPEPGIEENTPWEKAAVRVPVCWQDVPLTGAQEQRAASALVDMERWTEGLVVFASAGQAVRFMELVRISVTECSAGDGSPWQGREEELAGPWGDGVAVSFGSSTAPSQDPQAPLGETTLVVARVGRAVTYALRGSHGILGETVSPRGVAELRPALDHVAPQLCRYTVAGC